ncbi:hypothetical protein [Burkholderia pseudomallei]|uniref:hypothetical protein n=1 Tax=Burkholderia pseudomallei TaxID=28450 RepID=UPI0010160AFF|nr:hypothetical protein [Burkholderia pseudomallei]
MDKIARVGVDLAKIATQVHAVDGAGHVRFEHGGMTIFAPRQTRGGFARLDSLLRFLSGTSEAIMLPI